MRCSSADVFLRRTLRRRFREKGEDEREKGEDEREGILGGGLVRYISVRLLKGMVIDWVRVQFYRPTGKHFFPRGSIFTFVERVK